MAEEIAEKVIEENRRYYNSDYADRYDEVHPVQEQHYSQKVMRKELQSMLRRFEEEPLRAADLGCGTGTLTFNFLRVRPKNITITAVDLAERMIQKLKEKAEVDQQTDKIVPVVAETQNFLENTVQPFHLIGFASALHHFPDYLTILRLAADHLVSGGYLYIHQEPLQRGETSALASAINYVDTRLYFCLHVFKIEGMPRLVRWMKLVKALLSPVLQRLPLVRPLLRRLSASRLFSRLYDDGRYSDDRMKYVEYHEEGIDRQAVIRLLEEKGMAVEYYGNAPDKHYRFFYALSRLFRAPSHFTLIARKK